MEYPRIQILPSFLKRMRFLSHETEIQTNELLYFGQWNLTDPGITMGERKRENPPPFECQKGNPFFQLKTKAWQERRLYKFIRVHEPWFYSQLKYHQHKKKGHHKQILLEHFQILTSQNLFTPSESRTQLTPHKVPNFLIYPFPQNQSYTLIPPTSSQRVQKTEEPFLYTHPTGTPISVQDCTQNSKTKEII